jgi:hypothetical protein
MSDSLDQNVLAEIKGVKTQIKAMIRELYINRLNHLHFIVPDFTINEAVVKSIDSNDNWPTHINYSYSIKDCRCLHLARYKNVELDFHISENNIYIKFPDVSHVIYATGGALTRNWMRDPVMPWETNIFSTGRLPNLSEVFTQIGYNAWPTTRHNAISIKLTVDEDFLQQLETAFTKYSKLAAAVPTSEAKSRELIYARYLKLRGNRLFALHKAAVRT